MTNEIQCIIIRNRAEGRLLPKSSAEKDAKLQQEIMRALSGNHVESYYIYIWIFNEFVLCVLKALCFILRMNSKTSPSSWQIASLGAKMGQQLY